MGKAMNNSKTINCLIHLDDELRKENNLSLGHYIGIDICREEGSKYDCTPDDAIVFAFTGMGGDHFAFDTKNGRIEDLDAAPILFIQPMMFDNPLKLVAHHIRDLFSIFLTLKEFYILERFGRYHKESDMLEDIEKYYKESSISRQHEISFISERLQDRLNIAPIPNVFKYITEMNGGYIL
ncbi:hypothetical protein AV654_32795 [Paenibacillus elgii]|uniref:Uncharacterized protein n=1 Tax=Paenibacillus elgii TaxID=189691 RepID=A0A165Q1K9_9BACL|nr:hypothetical protein [Paenibacillus elgii]KZE73344.1 hypothetical protein AV654_32795 [Paenibacillus elgii]PUA38767.1 hypothetical protein C8Z91_14350 [Paenibacillus elgii]